MRSSTNFGHFLSVKDPLERERRKYSAFNCTLSASLMADKQENTRDGNEREEEKKDEKEEEEQEGANILVMKAEEKKIVHKTSVPNRLSGSLPPKVLKEMKSLEKLAAKKKLIQVTALLDEWQDTNIITEAQRRYIEEEMLNMIVKR